jgi:hypothetical protein
LATSHFYSRRWEAWWLKFLPLFPNHGWTKTLIK